MPTTITSAGVTFNDTTTLTSATLVANSVGTTQITNGSVTAAKLGTTEQKQIAKAWVNFNGTGTIGQAQTIRSSYNVSSVTKNAVGDYTVNFATAMSDANYSISPGGGNNLIWSNQLIRTTTQFQLQSGYVSSTGGAIILQDSTAIYAVIFGN